MQDDANRRHAQDNDTARLPSHYAIGRGQRLGYGLAIFTALALLIWMGWRLSTSAAAAWWWLVPVLAGVVAADLLSGLVHWGADTWGRDDLPVIGRRLLVPFRVHHINPDDFLRRSFLDTNGDVAQLFLPCLFGALWLRLEAPVQAAAASFVFGLTLVGLLTNQTHQWAHMPSPPRLVRWFQDRRLILGRRAHAHHHARPYDVGYCIATGWCNGLLEAMGFFRRLECIVTWITHVEPRRDDDRYATLYDSAGEPAGTGPVLAAPEEGRGARQVPP
jgi:hypothetical protein